MTPSELEAIKKRVLAVLQADASPLKEKPELAIWDVLALIVEVRAVAKSDYGK